MVHWNKLAFSAAHCHTSSIKVCCAVLSAGLGMLEASNKWFPRITLFLRPGLRLISACIWKICIARFYCVVWTSFILQECQTSWKNVGLPPMLLLVFASTIVLQSSAAWCHEQSKGCCLEHSAPQPSCPLPKWICKITPNPNFSGICYFYCQLSALWLIESMVSLKKIQSLY